MLALSGARPVNTDAAWIDLGEAVVPVETGVHPPAFSLPFTSEDPNTVIVGGPDDWTWTSQTDPAQPPTPHAFCVTFTLTSPSATPVPFRVTTHLGVPPFNFTAPFTAIGLPIPEFDATIVRMVIALLTLSAVIWFDRKLEQGNGWTFWTLSWATWLKGSALQH